MLSTMTRLPPAVVPLFLAVLALSALTYCSSTPDTPSEYHQGAYRAPPPPVLRPGVGAPTYSPHLQPGIQVEPGPKLQRALPQTPETQRQPGIWASDAPEEEGPSVELFKVPWPLPPEAKDSEAAMARAKECAAELTQQAWKSHEIANVLNRGGRIAKCVAMRSMEVCISKNASKRGRWPELKTTDAKTVLEAMKRQAELLSQMGCASPHVQGEAYPHANWIIGHWEASHGWYK
jgi:hypothetical protein